MLQKDVRSSIKKKEILLYTRFLIREQSQKHTKTLFREIAFQKFAAFFPEKELAQTLRSQYETNIHFYMKEIQKSCRKHEASRELSYLGKSSLSSSSSKQG